MVKKGKKIKTLIRALARDRLTLFALVVFSIIVAFAMFPGIISPYDPGVQSLVMRNQPPGTPHPEGGFPHILGTDQLGRDVLSRLIYASRISILVGIAGVIVSGSIGITLGIVAGYFRGKTDDIIMRGVDVVMGFPDLLFALFILFILGSGFWNIVIVFAVIRWPVYARVARSLAMSLRESSFIDAAKTLGCTNRRILLSHMLPNLLSPMIVLATLEVARLILSEAALSFLGLGIQAPDTSWGLMLSGGRQYMRTAWWLAMLPGIMIALTALSVNLIATWMRSVTDPVQRWRWLRNPQSTASVGEHADVAGMSIKKSSASVGGDSDGSEVQRRNESTDES